MQLRGVPGGRGLGSDDGIGDPELSKDARCLHEVTVRS